MTITLKGLAIIAIDQAKAIWEQYPIGSVVLAGFVVSVSSLYYLYNRNLNYYKFKYSNWSSYEVEKGIRRNKLCPPDSPFVDSLDHTKKGKGLVKTVYDCLMHGLEASNDGPCLGRLVDNGTRYEWLRYSEVKALAELIGKFLGVKGLTKQAAVGIYAANSCEWIITELACVFHSIIAVPLYDTLGIESICHSINEVDMAALFSDSEKKLKQILAIRSRFPSLKIFVLMHDKIEDATLVEQCKSQGVELLTWSQAKSIGTQHPEITYVPPTPDTIYSIQYTSGTTGVSKGVVITNRNMVSAIGGTSIAPKYVGNDDFLMGPQDTSYLYLPLAHVYAQCVAIWFLYAGGKIGFSSGNTMKMLNELQLLQPTYFPLVPRIMNRIYAKVVDETKTGFKGWLFRQCYARKKLLHDKGICTANSIYDWVLFRHLQKMLGGKIRLMTSASAPVAIEVLEFWRIVFGAAIMELYGQTESTGAASGSLDMVGGHVGVPALCTSVRLLDLPELGYTTDHNPPQGEVCLKGSCIMQEYYKRPQLTKEAFTPDGWLMTGDIGEFLPNGALRIIDRKKNIFKLCQGEYVAPEKVECIYAESPIVGQVFVDGSSLQTYVVAIVVPDESESKKWAAENGVANASFPELCKNKAFQNFVLKELAQLGKEKSLNSLEQVKSVYLHWEPFSIDNGLLTPSMKNKRNDLRRRYQAEIEALYKAGPMITSTRADQ